MSTRTIRNLAGALLLCVVPAALSAQVFSGKSNTFEDGTTQGWQIFLVGASSPPPVGTLPTNISTGGPAGGDDNYLRLTSSGSNSSGGRLTALNTEWGGDWLAAGITHVRFDARNFGTTDITLRLLVEDAVVGPPANVAVSSSGVFLPAESGWLSFELSLFGSSGLTALLGTVEGALTNATIIRLYHGSTIDFPAIPIAAQIGIDNFTALGATVPEPSALLLLAAAVMAFAWARMHVNARLRLR